MVLNDEIITKEKIKEYEEKGLVESVSMGVSEEKRQRLFEKLGDKIGDKEFIILIKLRPKVEDSEKEKASSTIVASDNKKASSTTKLKTNQTAPEFTAKMLDGNNIKLSDLKGESCSIKFLGNLVWSHVLWNCMRFHQKLLNLLKTPLLCF